MFFFSLSSFIYLMYIFDLIRQTFYNKQKKVISFIRLSLLCHEASVCCASGWPVVCRGALRSCITSQGHGGTVAHIGEQSTSCTTSQPKVDTCHCVKL